MRTRTKFIVKNKLEFDSPKIYGVFLKETVTNEEYFVLVFKTTPMGLIIGDPIVIKKFSSKRKAKRYFKSQIRQFQDYVRWNERNWK